MNMHAWLKVNYDSLTNTQYKHKHRTMLLLFCAERQICIVDTLSAITRMGNFIFLLKPRFKLGFKPNFNGLKPN